MELSSCERLTVVFCAGFGPGITNCICVSEGPVPETEGTVIGTTNEPVAGVGDSRMMGGIAGPGTPATGVGTGGVNRGPFGFTISGLGMAPAGVESGGVSSGPFGLTISGLGTAAGGAAPNSGPRQTVDPVTVPAGDVTSAGIASASDSAPAKPAAIAAATTTVTIAVPARTERIAPHLAVDRHLEYITGGRWNHVSAVRLHRFIAPVIGEPARGCV
jgi:hypothetical protein